LADRQYDFWADPATGRSADIMASPGEFNLIEKGRTKTLH